jgi:hypothetical protein
MASEFFFKPFVAIPKASVITGVFLYLIFHICCTTIRNIFYLSFFSASFCVTFLSAGTATSISVHIFSFLFFIFISGLFALILCYYYYYYYYLVTGIAQSV